MRRVLKEDFDPSRLKMAEMAVPIDTEEVYIKVSEESITKTTERYRRLKVRKYLQRKLGLFFEDVYGLMVGDCDRDNFNSDLKDSIADEFDAENTCGKILCEDIENAWESLKKDLSPHYTDEDKRITAISSAYDKIIKILCQKAFNYGIRAGIEFERLPQFSFSTGLDPYAISIKELFIDNNKDSNYLKA